MGKTWDEIIIFDVTFCANGNSKCLNNRYFLSSSIYPRQICGILFWPYRIKITTVDFFEQEYLKASPIDVPIDLLINYCFF